MFYGWLKKVSVKMFGGCANFGYNKMTKCKLANNGREGFIGKRIKLSQNRLREK